MTDDTRSPRFRNWCFTLNNPTETDDPKQWPSLYCVWQLERAETGTLHFQGFLKLSQPVTLLWLRERCSERAHWEVARNVVASIQYCQKEDTRVEGPWEVGKKPPGQGHRSDLEEIKNKILEGASNAEIANDHYAQWCQYRNAFKEFRAMQIRPRGGPPTIKVYWGKPGVGKSMRAMWDAPGAFMKMMTTGTGDWWDGYDAHDAVIINDFYGWIQHCELLRLLDCYPHQIKVHGGYVPFVASLIIITSNVHPMDWYNPLKFKYVDGPLERRLTEFGTVSEMRNKWTQDLHPNFIGPRLPLPDPVPVVFTLPDA